MLTQDSRLEKNDIVCLILEVHCVRSDFVVNGL